MICSAFLVLWLNIVRLTLGTHDDTILEWD